MKNNISVSVVVIVSICFVIFGCGHRGKPQDFDFGTIKDGTYINAFFDFKIELPNEWDVLTGEDLNTEIENCKSIVIDDNEAIEKAMSVSEINSANLLFLQAPKDSLSGNFSANVGLVCENIKNAINVESAKDYLQNVQPFLKMTKLKYESMSTDYEKVTLGNAEFESMETVVNYNGNKIRQLHCVRIIKDFAFVAILSYKNDDQKQMIFDRLAQLEFNQPLSQN